MRGYYTVTKSLVLGQTQNLNDLIQYEILFSVGPKPSYNGKSAGGRADWETL